MKDIQDRKDLYLLVCNFYDKVKKEELLAPIFNTQINNWDNHLIRLTDFWETNLFGIVKFKGSPTQKHIDVDKNHTIEQIHFAKWLELWIQTIDGLFQGIYAEKAKNAAQKMAKGQFLAIWNSRLLE